MSRASELLEKAIEALEDMRDPFDHSFLVEHEVTADECFGLSEQLAMGGKLFLHLKDQMMRGGIFADNAAMYLVEAEMARPGKERA